MLMVCDRAGAILGGMSEAKKLYVMGGKDRVMSGSKGVSRRLLSGLCENRRLNERTHFSQRRKDEGV
jgi:hypothetical protein